MQRVFLFCFPHIFRLVCVCVDSCIDDIMFVAGIKVLANVFHSTWMSIFVVLFVFCQKKDFRICRMFYVCDFDWLKRKHQFHRLIMFACVVFCYQIGAMCKKTLKVHQHNESMNRLKWKLSQMHKKKRTKNTKRSRRMNGSTATVAPEGRTECPQ